MAENVQPAPESGSDAPEHIQFELEQPEIFRRVAHVTVDADHVESLRVAVAKQLQKQAKMPGFRQGKVPMSVVRKNYADQIEQNTLERIIPEAYRAVLRKHDDIHPIADPRVEHLSLDEGQPVKFDLLIEVRPEVELKGYQGLEVERIPAEVSDDRVAQALDELAERNAQWHPVERAAKVGDAMQIDFAPLGEDGQPDEEKREENYALELGSDGVLPEFNAALEGLQAGEDTQVEVTYPENYPREELAGTTKVFDIKIKDIREKRVPAVDDDLAQSISQFQTLDELRAEVRKELESAAKEESDKQLRDSLIDRIRSQNEIPVPPSLEARYLQAMAADYQRLVGRDMNDAEKQEFPQRYAPAARRMAERTIILDNVRRHEGITVTDEEVDARIAELAEKRGVTAEEFRQAVEASQNLDRLHHDLEEEKIFAYLLEHANVVDAEAPAEADADSESESKE
jgi:trigger factor